ncbi:mitochondrial ribosomal subunit protein-domain-containing protein [Ampelomyces quisqualis]|uniref:Mitochondrial ribosomal subunit protein-domain-containing protein n=1 Tax=Ampelomyces quisqualis TaxID=50730 RepID=A0A6A5Q7U8_AMPQU|nr:mitochondrial ribosomal subunit protein-domain-containing protein [Ampelomyces quisqualis]
MASLPRRLLLQSRKCPSRTPCRASAKHTARTISTTPRLFANGDFKSGSYTPAKAVAPGQQVKAVASEAESPKKPELSEDEQAAAQLAQLVSDLKALDPSAIAEAQRKGQRGHPFAADWNLEKDEDFEIAGPDMRKAARGFWAEGEEELGPDEDYYGDDITSLGHGELANHRMLREYNRLTAWDLPLLSQLAKPFTPPTSAHPFRFRYTSYLGESHPAINKVVVEFDPTDLSLPDHSLFKLIKLAGPRYNPSTSVIKLSCEKFDTQAQNKRYLGETITTLVAEAKDTTDLFDDVPFDFRHHKPKKRAEFPEKWVLTPQRKAYLERKRIETAKLEDERRENGTMIDGKMLIDTSLPFVAEGAEEAVPLMVSGRR